MHSPRVGPGWCGGAMLWLRGFGAMHKLSRSSLQLRTVWSLAVGRGRGVGVNLARRMPFPGPERAAGRASGVWLVSQCLGGVRGRRYSQAGLGFVVGHELVV